MNFVFWMTGLSGSGKSTLAINLLPLLNDYGINAYWLDGDHLRKTLNSDLGFSIKDREENIRRAAWVARFLLEAGITVIASFITPTSTTREIAREIIGKEHFRLVYVKADVSVCKKRDPKKLYKMAEAGKLTDFTGIHQEFEEPYNPDLIVDTSHSSIQECTLLLFSFIKSTMTGN